MNLPVYRALNVPHRPAGSLYVGYTAADCAVLADEASQRSKRGDTEPSMLSASEARRMEPLLDVDTAGALLVPGETVVDPWLVPIAYARHAHENGAVIRCSTDVTAAVWESGQWELTIAPSSDAADAAPTTEAARIVVACGGLQGDHLEALHREAPFAIKPRRGDYVLFEEAAELGGTPLGQVPTASSRGLYVWRSVHGVVACGPTAEEVDERHMPPSDTDPCVSERLRQAAVRAVPALGQAAVVGTYAGLRPGSSISKDYLIERQPGSTWISVGGIRSTGLTASLGIGRHVGRLCSEAVKEMGAPPPQQLEAPVTTTPLPPIASIVESFRTRGDGSVVLGSDEMDFGAHFVTHPLTRLGFARQAQEAARAG